MAREEQNTQQPTGGKGPSFHRKKQNISKGELPKQKGARGIIVEEKLKTMDEVGQSVASKKGKRPCSGLSEEEREKTQNEDCKRCRKKKRDRSLKLQNIEKQQNDFFEKFESSSFEHLQVSIDGDFIELDDLANPIEYSSSKRYSLNKLENKIIKLNKDHGN